MPPFVYRCPNTGMKADDPTEGENYEPITFTICTRLHLVNPKAGRVLEAGEDRAERRTRRRLNSGFSAP
jgi:hypothetical protein